MAQTEGADEVAEILLSLRNVVKDAEAQIKTNEMIFERLAALGDESEGLKDAMLEMTRLEERLGGIIETCGGLVRRLNPDPNLKAH